MDVLLLKVTAGLTAGFADVSNVHPMNNAIRAINARSFSQSVCWLKEESIIIFHVESSPLGMRYARRMKHKSYH